MIEKHNKEYKDGKVSFEMGLNEYSDLSHEEFKNQMNGFVFDPNMKYYGYFHVYPIHFYRICVCFFFLNK